MLLEFFKKTSKALFMFDTEDRMNTNGAFFTFIDITRRYVFSIRAMEKERLTAELSGSASLRDFNEIRCGEYAFRSDIPRYDL